MKYTNAKDVLPPELLAQIQEYLCGELIYIPRKEEKKACWGQLSGVREQVMRRNSEIQIKYRGGASVYELTDSYCLSESSIRKIIYGK